MEEMSVLCVAKAMKNAEDEDQLDERLRKVGAVLWNVWYAGAP
jgi:hypothetical protein